MKTCSTCQIPKAIECFSPRKDRPGQVDPRCKDCQKTRAARTRKANPDKHKKLSKDAYLRRKKAVFDYYGGVCVCCGESRLEFLVMDHKEQDGAEHRRSIGICRGQYRGTGHNFYLWLEKQGFPDVGLQILCANCNTARGKYGVCPHQTQPGFVDGLGI